MKGAGKEEEQCEAKEGGRKEREGGREGIAASHKTG